MRQKLECSLSQSGTVSTTEARQGHMRACPCPSLDRELDILASRLKGEVWPSEPLALELHCGTRGPKSPIYTPQQTGMARRGSLRGSWQSAPGGPCSHYCNEGIVSRGLLHPLHLEAPLI